ncbi:MAG: hypothetical protein IJV14_10235 [Lachnospiraceae bacterium]|nr:hypothetical protein [Lachnospiraceae bacterium]
MNEMMMGAPLSFMAQIRFFADVLEKYVPDYKDRMLENKDIRIKDIVTDENREDLVKELISAEEAFQKAMREEVREFGVDADPSGLRTRWGKPEINEQVVKMIEEQYPVEEHKGEVIFYGPSNITLWFSLEKDMEPYKAQNHGMGGCIDDDLMHYAPRLLYPYEPKVVFFQTGSNDIAGGIPLETILQNKKKMYAMFLENMPQAQLVVCSGLPLPGRTQFWDATAETNALLEKMCSETDRLHFLNATDAMLTDNGPEELRTSDGRYFNPSYFRMDRIHLNKKGHDVWTALMKEKLAELGI